MKAVPFYLDLGDHSLHDRAHEWTPARTVMAALAREPDAVTAIARRRQLRDRTADPNERRRQGELTEAARAIDPDTAATERAAAAIRPLQRVRYSRAGQSLGR